MRSSDVLSKIFIFTNAVWGLAADIGGLFMFVGAVDCERERDDVVLEERRDDTDGVGPCVKL